MSIIPTMDFDNFVFDAMVLDFLLEPEFLFDEVQIPTRSGKETSQAPSASRRRGRPRTRSRRVQLHQSLPHVYSVEAVRAGTAESARESRS